MKSKSTGEERINLDILSKRSSIAVQSLCFKNDSNDKETQIIKIDEALTGNDIQSRWAEVFKILLRDQDDTK